MTVPTIRLIALGGLGEFGLHMMLVESGEDVIAIDCGFMFPNADVPGVDYAIPDFSYLRARREAFRAVFLTHAHYDHLGAVPYLLRELPVPVYGSPLTLGILGKMLGEHRMLEYADLRTLKARDVIEVGVFRVEAIRVTHSVADGMGFAVRTPAGTVLHTGDFKLDHRPIDGERSDTERLEELGKEGVVCLLSDSTNVEQPGHTPSESEVGQAFTSLFERAPRRIIVATFATHIHRIQQIIDVAEHFKRKVGLLGRSMVNNVRIAQDLGYLRVPDDILVDIKDLERWPAHEQVIISTGSQGEPYSAIALMAAGQHRSMAVEQGDFIMISARVIPGNERHVANVISQLFRLGANVLYEAMDFVHVSGHASQEDLKLMLKIVCPRYFLPVHGELRHLVHHGRLAESVGVLPENVFVIETGHGLEMTPDSARVVGPFPVGKVYVQGKGVGDVGAVVLRDRQILSQDGLVSVSLVIDRAGAVVAGPEIASRGFVYVKESEALLEELRAAVLAALAGRDPAAPVDREVIGALVRSTVRHFINQRFQRKPVVLPVILEV